MGRICDTKGQKETFGKNALRIFEYNDVLSHSLEMRWAPYKLQIFDHML